MDTKLEGLINKIKKEGIDEAEKASEQILKDAQREAKAIVDEAKKKAEDIKKQAEEEAKKLKTNTESSLRQAARDLVLATKEQLVNLFNQTLKGNISDQLKPDFIKELIVKFVDKWTDKKKSALEILLSKEDKKKLEDLLLKEIKAKFKDSIEIKVSKTIDKGFRVGIKGETLHYDFTDESILESLKEFLNPTINSMLNSSNG
jgi:V/A-type H+-transporting ATPase subunit E